MPKISSYTEKTIPNSSTSYAVVADTGTNYKVKLGNVGFPAGHIFGLTLSNNAGDATNDIDIAAGKCRSSDDVVNLVLASALTKRLDAAWAVGTNQGGLDTGAIANTTYHVWLIMRSDTGVVDALFSASATAPTMPTNYDYKRRIGSIMRESAAIVGFIQDGDKFVRKVMDESSLVTNQAVAAQTRTLKCPTGIRVEAILGIGMYDTTSAANVYWLITDLSTTDTSPGSTAYSLFTSPISVGAPCVVMCEIRTMTNTSAQVRSRVDTQLADLALRILLIGWVDTRGRMA